MAFKKMDNNLGFADLVLESSRKHNRSLKNSKKLGDSIDGQESKQFYRAITL